MNNQVSLTEKLLAREEKRKAKAREYYLKKRYGDSEIPDAADTLLQYAGKTGHITLGKFMVNVRVLNAKNEYGRLRLLVEPISGVGQNWVQNVIFNKE